MATLELPGYRVVRGIRATPEEGLRNDVAGFLGQTMRGPLGMPVRVSSRRAYATVFGGQLATAATPRAVEAFFANEGEVAWVVRTGRGGAAASDVADLGAARRLTLPGDRLRVTATSPGAWANGTRVRVDYRAFGPAGGPELDVRIEVPGEPAVQRTGLAPDELLSAIATTGLVTASFEGTALTAAPGATGPAWLPWQLELADGEEPDQSREDYLDAVTAQAQVDEIALVCAPDLAGDLSAGDHDDVVAALARAAADGQDRLVILAGPSLRPDELTPWRARIAQAVTDAPQQRAVAAYALWLLAENLMRTPVERYAPANPVGHVCGVIARLDRERGSGWAPANALVNDAIDVTTATFGSDPNVATEAERVLAMGQQVNLLRCRVGGGLEIWGARTLDPGDGRQIAHRRLLHRLVRAIRRVAEPLVFDTNGPVLWFTVVRAVSGALLEAFRSGFLAGETPDQAYRVTCDATTNTPDRIDAGEVVCEIGFAPAAPMEFITLRLTFGAQSLLEVVEQ